MNNRKGMTMVEIIISIVLISVVLIFLMTLFVKVRETYNQSKVQSEYNILASNIISAIGNDIKEYGLRSIEYIDDKKSQVLLTFNEFRPYHLAERIKKVLRIDFRENTYFISYAYDMNYTKDITVNERLTDVIRGLPNDAVVDNDRRIHLESINNVVKIKIPFSTPEGNIYDINIYGILEGEG